MGRGRREPFSKPGSQAALRRHMHTHTHTHIDNSTHINTRNCQQRTAGASGGGGWGGRRCCAEMTIKKVPVRGKGQGWMGSGEPMLSTLGLKTVTMDLWPALACARATLRDKDAFSARRNSESWQIIINPGSKSASMEIRRPFSHNGIALPVHEISMVASHLAADTLLSIHPPTPNRGEVCGADFPRGDFPRGGFPLLDY